jgi:uncharacterized membrane protein YciS (DUF1049 family)
MLATFIIEFSLALYAVYRYHLNEVGKLIVAALVSLGIFQIAEYFVCGGYGLSGNTWSRIGYVAITALPPLGLHMMLAINKSSSNRLLMFSYGSMAAFMAYFLLSATAFTGYQCTGNYVIFQIGKIPAIMYGMYYYGWLLTALILGVKYLNSKVKQSKNARSMTKALMIGYGVFLVPTALAYTVNPETRSGIPSIMCGFAVLFALILAIYILPLAGTKKRSSQSVSKHIDS